MFENLDLVGTFGWRIAMLLAMIAADVILGIGAALKLKIFRWSDVADFYLHNIVPKLFGWLGAAILAHYVVVGILPEPYDILGPGIDIMAYTASVVALAGSIIRNFKVLGSLGLDVEIPFE